jgi:pimeloyl-ACP methyl ester carboxylesterase
LSALSVSRTRFHRIAYTDWGAPGTRGTVICVHGLTRQGRDFDFLAAALARLGYRVICPVLVGRGQSEWLQQPDDYDLPQYVVDMHAVLTSVGAQDVTWIGFSLGGLIGMIMAAMENTPISRFIINDIGPDIPTEAAFRIGNYVRNAPESFLSEQAVEAYFREILAPFGQLADEQWRHLARHSVSRVGGVFKLNYDPQLAKAFRHPGRYSARLWKLWSSIRCPSLVLKGADSDLFPSKTAQRMLASNAQAELIEFAGCGHLPPLLTSEQCAPVLDWLQQTQSLAGREHAAC